MRLLQGHQSLRKHRNQVLSVAFAHSRMGILSLSPHMAPSPQHLFHQRKVGRLKFGIYNQKNPQFHGYWVYAEEIQNLGRANSRTTKSLNPARMKPKGTQGLIKLKFMPELALSGKTKILFHTFCLDFPQLQP